MKQEKTGERLLIVYALNIIDVIYTLYFAFRFGVNIEGNELARYFWENNPELLVVFKLFGVGALLLLVYAFRKYKAAEFASKMLLIIFGALVLYHVVLLYLSIRQNGWLLT